MLAVMPVRSQFVGIWNWDVVRDRVTADSGLARIFSVPPESAARGIQSDALLSAVHPDDLQRLKEAIQRAVDESSEFRAVYRVLQKSGPPLRLLARGRVQEGGASPSFTGAILRIGEDLEESAPPTSITVDSELGPRELQCLEWCSHGKTNWEIGQILGISERTVEHHIAAAIRKLGSATRAQAVAEGIRLGLIA